MQRSNSQEHLRDKNQQKPPAFDRSTSLEYSRGDLKDLSHVPYQHVGVMSSPGAWIEYNKDTSAQKESNRFFEMINQHPFKHHQNTPTSPLISGHSMSSPLQHQNNQQRLLELSPLCPKYDIAGRSITLNETGSPQTKASTNLVGDLAQSPVHHKNNNNFTRK